MVPFGGEGGPGGGTRESPCHHMGAGHMVNFILQKFTKLYLEMCLVKNLRRTLLLFTAQ